MICWKSCLECFNKAGRQPPDYITKEKTDTVRFRGTTSPLTETKTDSQKPTSNGKPPRQSDVSPLLENIPSLVQTSPRSSMSGITLLTSVQEYDHQKGSSKVRIYWQNPEFLFLLVWFSFHKAHFSLQAYRTQFITNSSRFGRGNWVYHHLLRRWSQFIWACFKVFATVAQSSPPSESPWSVCQRGLREFQ